MKLRALRYGMILLAAGAALLSSCTPERPPAADGPASPLLAVFPFANYSGSASALVDLRPEIGAAIARRGLTCLGDEELRPILRRNRIRAGGVLGAQDLARLREETGAQALMLGSIDISYEGQNPELGLSMRILDLETLEILAARSVALTGTDFAGLFGIGRRDSLPAFRAEALDRLFEGLDPRWLSDALAGGGRPEGPRLALLGFEDLSGYPFAGAIFTQILGSVLVEEGFRLADPASFGELLLSRGGLPAGMLDLELSGRLHREIGVDWILTGSLSRFEPASSEQGSAPAVEVDARLLDARVGVLVGSQREGREGSPPGQFFGLEERRSLGRLAAKVARGIAAQVSGRIEEDDE